MKADRASPGCPASVGGHIGVTVGGAVDPTTVAQTLQTQPRGEITVCQGPSGEVEPPDASLISAINTKLEADKKSTTVEHVGQVC